MNGLPVIRVGDLCTGHVAAPSRPAISGSMDVFINNIPAVRVGDSWAMHGAPPHMGISITGSTTVFCNGLPLVRTGDQISCGSLASIGSMDTFCG